MAHCGKKGGFGLAGFVGFALGVSQGLFDSGAGADVGKCAQHDVLVVVPCWRVGGIERPAILRLQAGDGVGAGGAQHLAQEQIRIGRVVQLPAGFRAQPLKGQTVAEYDLAGRAGKHA
ncbi:hypothetical protein D3C72_1929240 [compost metagenome]